MTGILKLKPNQVIEHPNGGVIFGVIPAIDRLDAIEALIYLKAGMHRVMAGRPAAGYGVKHIWEGKKKELRNRGCTKVDDVPRFVSDLIVLGTEIYHDEAHPRADMKRITLLRTQDGTLLLEPLAGDRYLGFHYSVVTWTPRTQPKGIQVGTIEKKGA
ncbi:hypothetical protein BKM03_31800 (plasmid) [Pseudomonas avellanae]|uniref:Uncharacterized protein n=1 Tax=Pseudomonas avellanae TaxID=46257 RepID=A0AAD0M6Q3_9PSED|nr:MULTISPECIES: hypothetical protein [Pseudomonas syringae group]AVB23595.1 hypothetical protein BKM03_31800 [Pseudomonas avellanae]POD12715.1 hypothetical protein BKM05_27735 [Pseudomonas avellanae]POP69469.1 hypothetical protein CXB34_31365 [Pseudomonas amygdali pv. morsprunorum]